MLSALRSRRNTVPLPSLYSNLSQAARVCGAGMRELARRLPVDQIRASVVLPDTGRWWGGPSGLRATGAPFGSIRRSTLEEGVFGHFAQKTPWHKNKSLLFNHLQMRFGHFAQKRPRTREAALPSARIRVTSESCTQAARTPARKPPRQAEAPAPRCYFLAGRLAGALAGALPDAVHPSPILFSAVQACLARSWVGYWAISCMNSSRALFLWSIFSRLIPL